MKRIIFITTMFIVAITVTSCQSTKASLQRASATTIGNTLSSEIIVSNVKRGVSNVSWDAKKGNKCYKCEADDMVRRTSCKEVKCEE